jgi:hypothetical protein
MKRVNLALAGLAACYVSIATPAYAYLDGGTASMVIQGLLAGVATIAVFGRHQIARIKGLFSGRNRKSETADS